MKDFLGNPLSVGDQIVLIWHTKTSSSFREAEVVGFTPTMLAYYLMGDSRVGRPLNITPRKVVKILDAQVVQDETDLIRDGWSNGNSGEDRAHWRDLQ